MHTTTMRKIVVTGPESSGKTTLAESLAKHYHTVWVPEYARDYINQLDRLYQEQDLLTIAWGQVSREDHLAQTTDLLICDTSLLVIKIWSEYRYGRCHPWIPEQLAQRPVDLYLLCSPDIPWKYDPQRENAQDRDVLFKQYQQALIHQRYVTIQGNHTQRLAQAINAINSLRDR